MVRDIQGKIRGRGRGDGGGERGNNIVQLLCCNLNDNIDDYYFTM